jgi:alpha-L-arabinofuranosidase
MNKLLNSRAFTFGNDIYFDKGKYNPNTNKGMHLLAHELAHVIQQADRIQTKIIQKSEEAEPPKNATDEDTCSGWDKDPESLTIAAAKHYFKEEFDKDIMVKSVKCDASSEIIMCTLTLEDGSIVNVHFNPKRNIVRVQFKDSSGTMKHCRYNYSCNTDGTIVFTKISCG